MKWSYYPLVRISLPFVLGIVSAVYLSASLNETIIWALGILSGIGLGVLQKMKIRYPQRWIFGAALNLTFLCLGFILTKHYDERTATSHFSHQNYTTLLAMLDDEPVAGTRLKATLKVVAYYDSTGNIQPATGKIAASFDADSASLSLKYGDIVQISERATPAKPPMNPGDFDYRRYLHFQNVHYQSFIKKENWQNTSQNKGFWLYKASFAFRESFLKALKKHIQGHEEYAVTAALIIGYKNELDTNVKNAYQRTGAMHLLAVSGMHVGLLAFVLHFFLAFYRDNRKSVRWAKAGFVIAFIWGFALLTGLSGSVLRAASMFTLLTLGNAMSRESNIYNTLAGSAFLLLLVNPYMLFDAGFQLSYSAVIGIVYFERKITPLYAFENKILQHIWTLTSVSLAAQLGTLPLSLYYFGQFPVYFLLSGYIGIPLSTVALYLGVVLYMFSWIPDIADLIGWAVYGCVWLMDHSIYVLETLPFAVVSGLRTSFASMIVGYAAIFTASFYIGSKNIKYLYGSLASIALILLLWDIRFIKEYNSSEWVVYHDRKSILNTVSEGYQAVLLNDSAKVVRPVYEPHFKQSALEHDSIHLLSNDYKNSFLSVENNLLQFQNHSIQFISKNTPTVTTSDIVVLYDNPNIDIEKLEVATNCKLVILHPSNSYKRIAKWKESLSENGLDYYDISSEGAFGEIGD